MIVRPNNLTQDAGTGRVSAGRVHISTTASRQDVAVVVAACIENEGTVGLAFNVTSWLVPIKEAVEWWSRRSWMLSMNIINKIRIVTLFI